MSERPFSTFFDESEISGVGETNNADNISAGVIIMTVINITI